MKTSIHSAGNINIKLPAKHNYLLFVQSSVGKLHSAVNIVARVPVPGTVPPKRLTGW